MDEHSKASKEEARVKAQHETDRKLNRRWPRRRRAKSQRRTRSASAINSPPTGTDVNLLALNCNHGTYTLLHWNLGQAVTNLGRLGTRGFKLTQGFGGASR